MLFVLLSQWRRVHGNKGKALHNLLGIPSAPYTIQYTNNLSVLFVLSDYQIAKLVLNLEMQHYKCLQQH